MLSKNKIRFISSLKTKKARDEENLYVIEGEKIVREFLNAGISFKILAAKAEFLDSLPPDKLKLADEADSVSYEELKQMSSLKTPHNALAVIEKPDIPFNTKSMADQICVALDCVQDPGNLGTIIRAAAWFGIKSIVCSEDSVDSFNPKVIQASMGALIHVNTFYTDLREFLKSSNEAKVQIFGTFLEGDSIYEHKLASAGIILLGNESKGISDDINSFVTDRIFIPAAGKSRPGIESLNVGMAASVIFSEFMRRQGKKS